jgi:hypothetical protein
MNFLKAGGHAVHRRAWILLSLCFLIPCCALPEREGRENLVNIPLLATYASDEEGASHGLNLLFGIFERDVHEDGSHTRLFPLFFNTEGPGDDSFLLVLPFYYHKRRPYREDTFYFLFGKQWKEGRNVYHPLWPLVSYSPMDEAGRKGFFLFPLVDYERDGPKGSIDILNVLGLVDVFNHKWGYPPEPGGSGSRGSFDLLNVLNIVQLAGGNDLGAYEDFQLLTLLGSEKLSLYQRHWRRDGEDGRTILFPFYWHLKDEESECRHFWPLFSTSSGAGWKRKGILSDMFSLKKEDEGKKILTLFWLIPISWGDADDSSLEST